MTDRETFEMLFVDYFQAQKKEWELAGTNLGNIMGIEKTNDKEDKDTEDNMDHRENQKFADHMKVDQVSLEILISSF